MSKFVQCEGITKKGKPCQGGAMRGTTLCGAHHDKLTRSTVPPDEFFPVPTVKTYNQVPRKDG